MKVVHLVAGGMAGGAARGAYWLHHGLRKIGVESHLLTNSFDTLEDPTVTTVSDNFVRRAMTKGFEYYDALYRYRYPRASEDMFSSGRLGFDLHQHPLVRDADIVNLHWIANGLMALDQLARIEAPIVWTLRDMWAFTGGCHYALSCEKFHDRCSACPKLGSTNDPDLSTRNQQYKLDHIPSNVVTVAISDWLAECARESRVLQDHRIESIPNCVDLANFYPVPRDAARQSLKLDPGSQVILVGAQNIDHDYKGFDLFFEAISAVQSANISVMIFGESNNTISIPGVDVKHLGFVTDQHVLRNVYSASDVFVMPSRMEAFGKTIVESMACGTPVVCFDATGPRDLVDHQRTGFKANAFEAVDLASGIDWLLLNANEETRAACREAAMAFDAPVIAARYASLYESILSR